MSSWNFLEVFVKKNQKNFCNLIQVQKPDFFARFSGWIISTKIFA